MRAYALSELSADIVAVVDQLGRERISVVGHDWGGIVAWQFATRKLRHLDRLVCMNIPHLGAGLEGSTWRQRLRSWYVLFFQLPRLPERLLTAQGGKRIGDMFRNSARVSSAFDDGDVEVYRRNVMEPGAATAMINYYRALRPGPRVGSPERVRPPCLVIWGGRDAFLTRHTYAASVGHCENGEGVFLDEATHWVHLEVPETVNAEPLRFSEEMPGVPCRADSPVPGSDDCRIFTSDRA